MKASSNKICPTKESQFHHNYPIAGHSIVTGPLNRCLSLYLYIHRLEWSIFFLSLIEQKNSGPVDMNLSAKSFAAIQLIFVFFLNISEKNFQLVSASSLLTVCFLTLAYR